MTTYVACPKCKKFTHKTGNACEHCGAEIRRMINSTPALHIFKAEFYEHIDIEPIYISSKRQLREETRKRGMISDYAE